MPLQETSGNISADAYGGGAAAAANYIEDVFSTWLYTGNGGTQTITNGIDLAGKGGLVWLKSRSGATDHAWYDTARGATKDLVSNSTAAETTQSTGLTSFSSTGFSLGALAKLNTNSSTYVSWTFRKQPKFFDVVTYTGNSTNPRTIAHNLGSVPGCIMVKATSGTGDWNVYHRSLNGGTTPEQYELVLNTTAVTAGPGNYWNSTAPTSSVFSVAGALNTNGVTYVAYLFAHNAGGFGLSGNDNVISCGSFTTDASGNATVTLGYEPQWLLVKSTNNAGTNNWIVIDTMRGWVNASTLNGLVTLPANASASEAGYSGGSPLAPTSTGFQFFAAFGGPAASSSNIYIAIRRGPMKVPTDATKVFVPITANAAAGTAQTTGFVVDSQWKAKRAAVDTLNTSVDDRLRGVSTTSTASGNYLITSGTAAEATTNATTRAWNNTGFQISTYYASASDIFYNFSRAPSVFDVVCYTGSGANTTQTHNLGVAPELMIVKPRSATGGWQVYSATSGAGAVLLLNGTGTSVSDTTTWNNTSPTASVFSLGASALTNSSGTTYVAYLFASCPGVSKVGSYTGTGATQTISCGFTGGARFVLIKRTNSTGDWYVWDSARGMVAGTDPSLLLNSTAAEVNANSIYTTTGGFQIVSTAAGINASGGTYIYLAIA